MTAQTRIEHPVSMLAAVSDPETLRGLQESLLAVEVPPAVTDLILAIVEATRHDARLSLGASPRASMALYKGSQALAALRGRTAAEPADVRALALPVLLKRVSVRPEQQLKGLTEQRVIEEIMEAAAQ